MSETCGREIKPGVIKITSGVAESKYDAYDTMMQEISCGVCPFWYPEEDVHIKVGIDKMVILEDGDIDLKGEDIDEKESLRDTLARCTGWLDEKTVINWRGQERLKAHLTINDSVFQKGIIESTTRERIQRESVCEVKISDQARQYIPWYKRLIKGK